MIDNYPIIARPVRKASASTTLPLSTPLTVPGDFDYYLRTGTAYTSWGTTYEYAPLFKVLKIFFVFIVNRYTVLQDI